MFIKITDDFHFLKILYFYTQQSNYDIPIYQIRVVPINLATLNFFLS